MKAIIVVFCSLLVRELWTLLPYSDKVKNYFPYYNIKITFQSYMYFPCQYAGNLILLALIAEVIGWSNWFIALFALQVVEFGDYFLTYNTPWVTLFGFDIGITVFRIFAMFLITIYSLKWN